jgi:hypothetical protein
VHSRQSNLTRARTAQSEEMRAHLHESRNYSHPLTAGSITRRGMGPTPAVPIFQLFRVSFEFGELSALAGA